jgi:hypothetical protein
LTKYYFYGNILLVSLKQKLNNSSASPRKPITELDGYDMVGSDVLGTSNGFEYRRETRGTNTSGGYGIVREGQRVGYAALTFSLRNREVSFDIAISEPGHNLGATALRGLADTLGERDFSLVTAGIMPESRGYWEHLAAKGDVVPVDASDPNTQYRVVPTTPIDPSAK